MENSNPKIGSFIELHFIVILFGFTAILGKLITVSAFEVVFYRTLLACIGLLILLSFLKKSIKVEKKEATAMFLTGLVVCFHWFLFFYAARISNVSISLIGLATATLWVAILQPFIDKTKISKSEITLGMVMVFGLYLIFQSESLHIWGLVLSVLSGMFQALFSIINSRFIKRNHSLVITFYEMAGAAFFSAVFILIYWQFNPDLVPSPLLPSLPNWFYLSILAFVCSVYAYSGIVRLLSNISAFSINLAVNLEPIYGIILAFFFFKDAEKMNIGFYSGAIVIFLAVFGYQYIMGKK